MPMNCGVPPKILEFRHSMYTVVSLFINCEMDFEVNFTRGHFRAWDGGFLR